MVTQAHYTPKTHPLIRKLESVFTVSDEERQALIKLPMHIIEIRPDQDIVREGDRPSRCCLVLEGFACTSKIIEDGNRQIMNFHIAGDIPDLQSLHLTVLDSSLETITACTVGFIEHEKVHDLCRSNYRIASALWRETLIDASIFREWMASIGQRDAYSRIAHLLCEMLVRMRAVGLSGEDHSCHFPISQGKIADAQGLSAVHVNRILQELRSAKLISLKGGVLTALDWEGLKEAAEFDPAYLHLENQRLAN